MEWRIKSQYFTSVVIQPENNTNETFLAEELYQQHKNIVFWISSAFSKLSNNLCIVNPLRIFIYFISTITTKLLFSYINPSGLACKCRKLLRGGKHCFSLIMYGCFSGNALYSASLSSRMFIFFFESWLLLILEIAFTSDQITAWCCLQMSYLYKKACNIIF